MEEEKVVKALVECFYAHSLEADTRLEKGDLSGSCSEESKKDHILLILREHGLEIAEKNEQAIILYDGVPCLMFSLEEWKWVENSFL